MERGMVQITHPRGIEVLLEISLSLSPPPPTPKLGAVALEGREIGSSQ
jgi:hypothetical protein